MAVLIPDFHSVRSTFFFSENWTPLRMMVNIVNPPLHLAERADDPEGPEVIATIPELRELLVQNPDAKAMLPGQEMQMNTQQSAREVAEGRCRYCITNQHGLDTHGLSAVPGWRVRSVAVDWRVFVTTKTAEDI